MSASLPSFRLLLFRPLKFFGFALGLTVLMCGCGHSRVDHIGLMSFGDLEGKTIPNQVQGPTRECQTNAFGQNFCRLSDAVRDALKDSTFDTLIDVEVTNETSLWMWNNRIQVKGIALDSKTLNAKEVK